MGNRPSVWLVQQKSKADGTPYNLYKDGLKIYTTINAKMQKYAEEALKEHMANVVQKDFDAQQKRMNTAFTPTTLK